MARRRSRQAGPHCDHGHGAVIRLYNRDRSTASSPVILERHGWLRIHRLDRACMSAASKHSHGPSVQRLAMLHSRQADCRARSYRPDAGKYASASRHASSSLTSRIAAMALGPALACAALALGLVGPATTLACECSRGPTGAVRWPIDGATDVATDTPIVVWRYYLDGRTEDVGVSLTSADGVAVELNEVLRLPPPWQGCGKGEQLFLRPAWALHSDTTYKLTISTGSTQSVAATFTVGERSFEHDVAVDPVGPDVQYLIAYKDETCVQAGCADVGELLIDLGGPPQRPLWLVVKSSADTNGTNDWVFWPDGWFEESIVEPESRHKTQLSLALPADDACVELQLYGVEGRSLYHERRCSPDLCAIVSSPGASSCGGPPFSGVDASRIAAESCHPRGAPTDDDRDAMAPSAAKHAAAAGAITRRSHASGCSAIAGSQRRSGLMLQLLLLVIGLWLRSSRRS